MICKSCKREIEDDSIFCRFCGERQIKSRERKKELAVPKPVQLASGEWSAQIMIDGKRQRVKGATPEEYEAKARALRIGLIDARSGRRMSLEDAIEAYISANDKILSASTLRSYNSYKIHRFQRCMSWNIFAENNWQKAVNDEAKGDISAKTVINAWRLITAAIRAQGANVPAVNLPRKAKAERPWLTYKQIGQFVGAIKGQPCELGALMALHSMRLSELIAVRPQDVDLQRQEIKIRGVRVLDKNNNLVYTPITKTEASYRTIPIVIPRLAELLADAAKLEYVADTNEKRLYDQINKVCKDTDLPKVGVHGLRHSFASLAYHLDWTKKSTMQVGGWSNSRVVDEIYTHNADLARDIKKMKKHYLKDA